MKCFQWNINHHFIHRYNRNGIHNIFSTCFRRKICSPYNHLFYLSKEMDNVLTGEVGTFDMYAKFTVTKYLFTQPTQMILQWYTNLFNFWKLMNDENSRQWRTMHVWIFYLIDSIRNEDTVFDIPSYNHPSWLGLKFKWG